jgi:thiamine-monophosphate kinase
MGLESDVIKIFAKNNDLIGDDCAYLKKTEQLIATDTIVENTHFNLRYFSPKQIAHRLIISNYSDIQASGGKPKFALLNVSFPKNKKREATLICKYLNLSAKNLNIQIIGGDTTSSKEIVLSLTILSDKIKFKNVILRSTAKSGDSIYIFKNLGYSKLGFLNINKKIKLPAIFKKKSHKQFLEPKLLKYHDLFKILNINSCMDISDSLIDSLYEISKQSKKKLSINNLNLVNPRVFKLFNEDIKVYFKLILTSGEEYTPVFTMNQRYLTSKILSLFKKRGIEVVEIGKVDKGSGLECDQINLKLIKSFDHFKKSYSYL